MSELELVRTLYPELSGASDAARARARAAVTARFEAPRRTLRSRRRNLGAAAGLAAAVATAVLIGVATRGGEEATAATVALRDAAAVARSQPVEQPGPEEYLYVKSLDAYLDTSVYKANVSVSVLVPHVREVWLGLGGGKAAPAKR